MTTIDIVTGASSGIGREIYRYLLNYPPVPVVGVSRRGPDIAADLERFQPEEFLAELHRLHGPDIKIRVLVNCAGVMRIPETDVRHLMAVNFWAPYELTRVLEPLMDTGSCIINIGSLSGIRHEQDFPVYSATKAALHSLTASDACRLAPRGIRVNTISPGFFRTNLVDSPTPEELVMCIPLAREAETVELLPVVQAIIDCEYITGSNVVVDGGLQWA